MQEKENQRTINLFLLIFYTVLIVVLSIAAFLLKWETGAVLLLILGVVVGWWIHITEKIPDPISMWVYFILSMLGFFFYGIHESSIYDCAPVIILVMMLYSVTEKYSMTVLCIITYILTMCYDFVFVLKGSVEFSVVMAAKISFHFLMVFVAGYLVHFMLQRHRKEIKMTDKKIAELEEINRRTEDFLANVSHELRTPINAVTGITVVMLKNEEDEEKKKNLFSIQLAGHRLFSQIGDILDYTEIDTGRIKVSENTYIISSLINDIIVGNSFFRRDNKLELIFDVDAGIPSVLMGDEKKIRKILEHLIDNAFKFTRKGGIYVRVFALHKSYGINLCIRVSDTGVGIDDKELDKIKERFYQVNGGRNRRTGGLGLGLSIVYGMVSAMEGFIQIESTVGEGTTVTVSIPQKVSDEVPVMMLEKQEDLCIACYLKPEKYEVPEVREYYNKMISHLVQGLEMPLHRVFNMEEFEKLASAYRLTHLFIAREEYEENEAYFETLSQDMEVIVVADNDFVLPQGSRVKLLRKPFYSLSIANVLRVRGAEETLLKGKRMLCPGVRVLVVDDEPMNLMVAKGVFKEYQMQVTTVESGRKAIELCKRERFDLIFLDHMMPEMDGVETLKRLRRINTDTEKALTVIAFTANAVSGAREMFLQEGFDEFVSKPIETLELERILRKVLPKASIMFVDEKDRKAVIQENIKEQDNQKEEKTEEQILDSDSGDDEMKRLENAGINTQSGMQYCGGDRAFYVEMLTMFAKDAAKKEMEIRDFFEKEDLENYAVRVHALKSTSKMIGADSLSECAKQLELAAKNKEADYVREKHGGLLDEYHQVVQLIFDVFALEENASVQMEQEKEAEISKDELLGQLEELKAVCDTFEADRAESLISEMSQAVYQGAVIGELLSDVLQDVNDFEFGAASEKVETIIKKVEGGEAV